MHSLPATHQMQRAMFQRDSSFDGIFFIAVRTTNVFCRPSCPARKPLPENVRYFATPSEALFAGYRPCKRCRPLDSSRLPDWARRLLQDVEADPEDRFRSAELRRRGLDPARVRRLFLNRYGITFHAYVRARRLSAALQRIRDGAPLDDVVLGHGFESHSGFRSAFGKLFAATPGRSESASCIFTRIFDSPLGALILGANEDGLCLLEFTDRRMLEAQFVTLRRLLKSPLVPGTNPHIDQAVAEIGEYFAGKRRSFSVPLFAPGTPFQKRVWDAVRAIPFGSTRSYQSIARDLGSPAAARAVGRANGFNRIAILIPCHRVVTEAGTLGGYGGGLWRKQRLLELEQQE